MALPGKLELSEMIRKLPRHTMYEQPLEVRLLVWRDRSRMTPWSGMLAWGDSTYDPPGLACVSTLYGDRDPVVVAGALLSKVDDLEESYHRHNQAQGEFLGRVLGKEE